MFQIDPEPEIQLSQLNLCDTYDRFNGVSLPGYDNRRYNITGEILLRNRRNGYVRLLHRINPQRSADAPLPEERQMVGSGAHLHPSIQLNVSLEICHWNQSLDMKIYLNC